MQVYKLKKCKRVVGLSYTPDGSRLAVVTSEVVDHVGSVVWMEVASGEPERVIPLDMERFALSPSHDKLAVAHSPYTRPSGMEMVQWASVPAGGSKPEWNDLKVERHHIAALGFTPDGSQLALGTFTEGRRTTDKWEHAVSVWQLDRLRSKWRVEFDCPPGELAFSPDGTQLAVTGGPESDPPVHLFEPPGKKSRRFDPPGTRSRCLAFSPNGTQLAVANARAVYLLSTADLTVAVVLAGHKGQINAVAFTPDGRRLFSASHDGAVRVWDPAAGRLVKALDWKVGPVTALAVAPDGLTAAAAGKSGQVVVWDLDG